MASVNGDRSPGPNDNRMANFFGMDGKESEEVHIYKVSPELSLRCKSDEFKPVAKFISSIDCLQIIVKCCTFYEIKISPTISILVDISDKEYVGVLFWGMDINMAKKQCADITKLRNLLEIARSSQLIMSSEYRKANDFILKIKKMDISIEV